jgi:hypothetical protein
MEQNDTVTATVKFENVYTGSMKDYEQFLQPNEYFEFREVHRGESYIAYNPDHDGPGHPDIRRRIWEGPPGCVRLVVCRRKTRVVTFVERLVQPDNIQPGDWYGISSILSGVPGESASYHRSLNRWTFRPTSWIVYDQKVEYR